MTGRLLLTVEARADVAETALWYRTRSLRASDDFLLALGVAFTRLETHPTSNVVVDEATGTRRALLRKFPQRVLYLIDGGKIVVFAVTHHGRDDSAWRDRLRG